MKKLLLVLFGVIVVIVIAQKFSLLTYLFDNNKIILNNQALITPTATISQIINRPIIGIHYKMIDKQMASQNNIVEGAYITQIIKGSPAEKAELREEDIITQFNDRKISGSDELKILTNLVANKKPGDKVNLKIWRNKKIMDITLVLSLDQ